MDSLSQAELEQIYARRFGPVQEYRRRVWRVLVAQFFQTLVAESATVLDLGCGFGEFINEVNARVKLGMDLNANCPQHLEEDVRFIQQKTDRDKRSPGEGETERRKLPDGTQWVNWNPTRERLAVPRKRVLRSRQ